MLYTLALRQGPAALRGFAKPTMLRSAARAFHHSPKPNTFFTARTDGFTSSLVAKNAFQRAGSRAYSQAGYAQQETQSPLRKLLVGGAIFGGTLVAINAVFNRETREDGGMPPFEREYLNNTFLHTGLGVGIIGLTARQMIRSGFVYRIMVTNPWVFAIGGIAISFGTMIATRSISPDK